jgi:hypothetical protein
MKYDYYYVCLIDFITYYYYYYFDILEINSFSMFVNIKYTHR